MKTSQINTIGQTRRPFDSRRPRVQRHYILFSNYRIKYILTALSKAIAIKTIDIKKTESRYLCAKRNVRKMRRRSAECINISMSTRNIFSHPVACVGLSRAYTYE